MAADLLDTTQTYEAKKAATIAGLQREYDSFFQPSMETDLYTPDVEFQDPLISLSGVEAYQRNVDMLAGANAIGKLCFTDCGLTMHNVTSPSQDTICTRWTLQFRFKLLPWRPLAQFSGISVYELDSDARVRRQQDYWDSVNLQAGDYSDVVGPAALLDLLRQLAPRDTAETASGKELPYVLLRRTGRYEVRRYPQYVAIGTEYERRIDAFGTLGAYTNGANDRETELVPFVPSLQSIPTEDAQESKLMRWPLMLPALQQGERAPPAPTGRVAAVSRLAMVPTQVVAVLAFNEPTTETFVRGWAGVLRSLVEEDGLIPQVSSAQDFQLAQFDALNSLRQRRNEVWITLEQHPW
eukprot:CAMPEP_0119315564 /NCGR_PEP_ID=MMETSP1333-20130426/36340_1 /TAXON_ID=418940 /ORGANISM="Scyphosphaera apsteinii, Strain RCC1455" /LENGTH=352 /DNA_ID=CAMNT_0007320973 /DNA_START=130 /DNA_END=1188 /DNA_ORIENTATION=+